MLNPIECTVSVSKVPTPVATAVEGQESATPFSVVAVVFFSPKFSISAAATRGQMETVCCCYLTTARLFETVGDGLIVLNRGIGGAGLSQVACRLRRVHRDQAGKRGFWWSGRVGGIGVLIGIG